MLIYIDLQIPQIILKKKKEKRLIFWKFQKYKILFEFWRAYIPVFSNDIRASGTIPEIW